MGVVSIGWGSLVWDYIVPAGNFRMLSGLVHLKLTASQPNPLHNLFFFFLKSLWPNKKQDLRNFRRKKTNSALNVETTYLKQLTSRLRRGRCAGALLRASLLDVER